MKKILISTAVLALLATPVLAQDRHDDDHHGGPSPQHGDARPGPGPQHMAAPAAAPAAPAAAPAAAPNAMMMRHDNRDNHGVRNDDHRFDDNNRPGGNNFRPGDNNFHQGNNGNFRPGNNHPNFSSYHRNFSAPRRFHARQPYRRPQGWYSHRWTYGEILPSLFWAQNYWLNDWDDFGLMNPPPGTVWVRNGNDALLIDRYSGEVVQVEYGVFY